MFILASASFIELGQLLESSHSGAGLGLTIRVVATLLGFIAAQAVVSGMVHHNSKADIEN
ncbi:hypothetical protein [Stieleria sedimenti]|uniref:hypothetical protein n=1 Tax=Stieleria sedimenti TaxID=2976331 RepID=UPI00217FF218|nr:hypothetical protein [Stieleria sedimenti]